MGVKKKKKRTLLIDGDVIAYQACSSCEEEVELGDGYWGIYSSETDMSTYIYEFIESLTSKLEPTDLVFAFSDSNHNWRKDIFPNYKSNRKNTRKPIGIKYARKYISEKYKTYERPSLEADDVLGILSTSKRIIKGERLIVSADKDFFSIPGLFYRLTEPEAGVQEISTEDADRYHLLQSLMGDVTDGYKGCPGVGKVTAERLLDSVEPGEWWSKIVEAYEKAGLCEQDALVQARVARILRADDYDFKKKEVRLWEAE